MQKYALDEMMKFGEEFTLQRLADVPEAQINLVCLPANQELPAHNANSNVRLLTLSGEITLKLQDQQEGLKRHEMAAMEYGTSMQICNESDEGAMFLVIKTPNPSQLE